MVPKSLRTWFVIHFILDFIFSIPLILAPRAFLGLLGWTSVDPISARLVGAALIGIGGESYLGRNAGLESFRGMLNLKVLWSGSALSGLLLTLLTEGQPVMAWAFVVIFGGFCCLWSYYRVRLGREA
ncbi:MAG: hypothetical protein AB1894_19460 [Chloroflexota bacterium]